MSKTASCDLSGMWCPLPIIHINRHLKHLEKGSLLVAKVTDPLAAYDVPDYCSATGNNLEKTEVGSDHILFYLRKC
jgi:tRNA 2-thiouridine synthesizing protein A